MTFGHPLTEAIKLNLRLWRKRELVALFLLFSVDIIFLLSFFVSSSRCLFNDCCISWLNSLTDSYMIRVNSEYDQELPQSQTEDMPIANSYTYETMRYMVFHRTHLFENTKYSGLLKKMCFPGFLTMPIFLSQTLNF